MYRLICCFFLLTPGSVAWCDGPAEPRPHPSASAFARRIDELLDQRLAQAGIKPSPPAADGEFLRRVTLDLLGVIPRVGEVRGFLADSQPDKRERLIDEARKLYQNYPFNSNKNR